MVQTSLRVEVPSLSRLIHMGYEASLDEAVWRALADQAAKTFGCQLAIVEIHDKDNPENSFLVAGGLDGFEGACRSALTNRDDDLYWMGMKDQPSGTVRLGTEIVDQEYMRGTRIYESVAMPWRLDHFLLSAIETSGRTDAYLALGRTARETAFTPEDKVSIKYLIPHLRRSIALHRELEAAHRTNALLTESLDLSPFGIVIFDHRGHPVHVNREAAEIFAAGDALTLQDGALYATDPATRSKLAEGLSIARQSGCNSLAAPVSVLVDRAHHPQPYEVMFAPLNSGIGGAALPSSSTAAALIYAGRVANAKNVPGMLAVAYGLSHAEVRLCECLLRGQSLLDAAETLHVSRNTVKTHLARVFDKTGAHSQTALVRLLTLRAGNEVTKP